MGIKKIVIVTTGQPSTNPRAVKEATALVEAGYEVSFIYNYWADWALPFDRQTIKKNPAIGWQMAGTNPITSKPGFVFSRIRHKYFRLLPKVFPESISIANQAASRGFSSLAKMASKIKADLYIAHNLGALSAAALAAKRNHAKYSFDAEDYHRGQEAVGSIEQKRAVILENEYLPGASYITAASPLIAKNYGKLYNLNITVINNVFSKKYLVETIKEPSEPIQLFWFSQTIGKGRGLEDIILALKEMPVGAFSLTLLGKHNETIKNYFMALGSTGCDGVKINFMDPVSSDEIFTIAADHDIGLALETGRDENNKVALSNKIFTYLLAGNAIIFSDTSAQRKFYEDHPGVGSIYECGNTEALKNILKEYQRNLSKIETEKINAQKTAATKYNWETEKKSLVKIIEKILHE